MSDTDPRPRRKKEERSAKITTSSEERVHVSAYAQRSSDDVDKDAYLYNKNNVFSYSGGLALWIHPATFRTRKLNAVAPMILDTHWGK